MHRRRRARPLVRQGTRSRPCRRRDPPRQLPRAPPGGGVLAPSETTPGASRPPCRRPASGARRPRRPGAVPVHCAGGARLRASRASRSRGAAARGSGSRCPPTSPTASQSSSVDRCPPRAAGDLEAPLGGLHDPPRTTRLSHRGGSITTRFEAVHHYVLAAGLDIARGPAARAPRDPRRRQGYGDAVTALAIARHRSRRPSTGVAGSQAGPCGRSSRSPCAASPMVSTRSSSSRRSAPSSRSR